MRHLPPILLTPSTLTAQSAKNSTRTPREKAKLLFSLQLAPWDRGGGRYKIIYLCINHVILFFSLVGALVAGACARVHKPSPLTPGHPLP